MQILKPAQSTMLHSTLLMPSAPHVGCSQSRGSIRAYIVWDSPKCADPPTPEVAALWVLAEVPVVTIRLDHMHI